MPNEPHARRANSPASWKAAGVGLSVVALAGAAWLAASRLAIVESHAQPQSSVALAPTKHPDIPSSPSEAWLVPADAVRQERANRPDVRALRDAVEASRANRHEEALRRLEEVNLEGTPLEPYVEYYRGLSELRLRRHAAARQRLATLRASLSHGRLRQLALAAEAEAALGAGDPEGAVELFAAMYPGLTSGRDVVLDQWATALRASGRQREAAETWLRLYYEFPASRLAPAAARQADAALGAASHGIRDTFPRDLTRAEALIAAGRAREALAALENLLPLASSTERDHVRLRIAEASCALNRCATQVSTLRELSERGVGNGHAHYLLTRALQQAGQTDAYIAEVRRLVAVPTGTSHDTWAERALNDLGTRFIVTDRDAEAAEVFKQLFERNPRGRYAERAAWKYGWHRYRQRDYAEAARVFDLAAASIPRANTRPAWVYWSGRARAALGDRDAAVQRLTLAAIDYGESYYGRLAISALERLEAPIPTSEDAAAARAYLVVALDESVSGEPQADRQVAGVEAVDADETPASFSANELPPTAEAIEWLVSAGLLEEAREEVRYAQRAWGSHPRLDATLAWTYRQEGEMRPAINTMRRAYPQYLSVQGTALPLEVQQVIFPIDYVPLIKRYTAERRLDPFIVAALIGQESSYVPDARSPANAWGLMQILPSTGRQLARAEGISPFSTSMLTQPEINIRLGTRYFARLLENLGGTHYALAAYNAGTSRVIRWKTERGPLEQAEFIDDIPYPETQIYVKKILGTAVDYRRLYGDLLE